MLLYCTMQEHQLLKMYLVWKNVASTRGVSLPMVQDTSLFATTKAIYYNQVSIHDTKYKICVGAGSSKTLFVFSL